LSFNTTHVKKNSEIGAGKKKIGKVYPVTNNLGTYKGVYYS